MVKMVKNNSSIGHHSKFFVKAKEFFITVPQSMVIDKQVIKQRILSKEKDLKGFLISKEYHKDKGIHYHILLIYLKYKFIKNPERFDYLLNQPTHIEKVRNLELSVEYCKKDGDFLLWGDLEKDKNLSASDVKNIVYDFLCETDDFNKLFNHPSNEVRNYFLNHIKTIQTAFSYIQNRKRYEDMKSKLGFNEIDFSTCKDIQSQEIVVKLNEMSKYKWNRPHKSLNLHIFSRESGFGKSTLLKMINDHCPSYIYPPINWFQEYLNNIFHCILWDEFSLVGWDIQFLNLFLEGQPVDLPIKYSFNITKLDNPLVIMCSNRSLREHIIKKLSVRCVCSISSDSDVLCIGSSKCSVDNNALVQYKTLKSRIKEIELDNNIFDFMYNILKKNTK